MGIVNVTPDSFSDGGRYSHAPTAVAHALALLDDGAGWVDVGGESTRPGAEAITAHEEMARVVPVIEGILAARPAARVSVDTQKAEVARAAIGAGATMVNDVSALSDPSMALVCAEAGVEVVLMHMRGRPSTMQHNTAYTRLVAEVIQHLLARVDRAVAAGVSPEKIWLDPGIGFGKAPADNLRLIAAVPALKALGFRVLVGASRKRFIGDLTGVSEASERVHGSVGAALAAAQRGADLIRVHDVAATHQALTVFQAVA